MGEIFKQKFNIFNHDGRHWIWLDDIFQLLASQPSEMNRPSKVERHLQGYQQKDRIAIINNRKALPMISLLKYVFHRMDNSKACEELAQSLEKSVVETEVNKQTGSTDSDDETSCPPIFDLYQKIAPSDIGGQPLLILASTSELWINDHDIPTLVSIHQQHFSHSDWTKIKLFEMHFGYTWTNMRASINQTNNAKWQFWTSYCQSTSLKAQILKDALAALKRRQLRKDRSLLDKQPTILCGRKHLPTQVEEDVKSALQIRYPSIGAVLVVDYDESPIENILHVYVEVLTNNGIPSMANEIIWKQLENKHQSTAHIFYFSKGMLDEYRSSDEKIARFAFRDAVLLGRLNDNVIQSYKPLTEVQVELENDDDEGQECRSCFPHRQDQKPLDFQSMDVVKEWFLDVPLHMQTVLEPFLNARSLQRTSNHASFLERKLLRIYGVYDTLLHTYNKHYFGIIQEANTDELVMGYKSIETVFHVTTEAGISTSLSVAEKRLKQRASKDDLYYAAYLKPYPLLYQTDAGTVNEFVRMRDCYVILMLDNLVRLKHNDDPDRGENRSKQMCLLPITVQGLPKNSAVVTSWHDGATCDGSDNCPCKQPVALAKSDIDRLIFKLTAEEALVKDKYSMLCPFGNQKIVDQLVQHGEFSLVLMTSACICYSSYFVNKLIIITA